MRRRCGFTAGILFALLSSFASAQSVAEASTPFELGRAAMAAHDPAPAIANFEQVDSREGREWLAVALMMESRSPSDQYVERAFEAAERSRVDRPEQARSRANLAASLAPGEMVIAFLIADTHSYAWALDHDALVGFPLPPPADLSASVAGVRAYLERNDPEGVARIAEQLLPALLGPVEERLPTVNRLILVMDGPLRQLSMSELGRSAFPRGLVIATADYASLTDAIVRARAEPGSAAPGPRRHMLLIGSLVVILFIAGVMLLRRR
jgi:hypothetical protein